MQSNSKKYSRAVIDLGTNTFHLLILDDTNQVVFELSEAAKIGMAGINQGIITDQATSRAVEVLKKFSAKIAEHQIDATNVLAVGTSAVRNASNQSAFCEAILAATGIKVEVITGQQEAALIYEGVRCALKIGTEPALIIDIGGGSVECIIGNDERIFWKQSFEIGGQRLLERYMATDPISESAVRKMNDYFREVLLPLHNAYHQYAPTTLIGSSGSFDTLVDLYFMHQRGCLPDPEMASFDLPLHEFNRSYAQLIAKNRSERMSMPGMIELRVEMIVVAVVLVKYILANYTIKNIRVSSFALKEGLAALNQPLSNFS